MNAVPFLDLRAAYTELREEIDAAVARVLASGWYLQGPEVEAFEREFAEYCGAPHCVAVGSGGDALQIALLALGVGAGDEVIVPSHTFFATWSAVSASGARPVPVEPDASTGTLGPDGIEAAVTPRTRAILPVHLYGQPADLDPIEEIAARHGLAVVEDAAQAHGARYRGRRIGAGSQAAVFSFYPGKNLGALGDGGAIVTRDAALADRMRLHRAYGSRVKYRHEIVTGNSRLDELQAAVLRVKLGRLDEWNARRAGVAGRYLSGLAGLDGLAPPVVPDWARPVWHLFVVRSGLRDKLQERLTGAGIGTLIHYPVAVHRTEAYARAGWPAGSLPVAERFAAESLSLPIGPHLTGDDVDRVIEAVRTAL